MHVVLSLLLVGRHFVSSIVNGARKVPEAEANFVINQTGGVDENYVHVTKVKILVLDNLMQCV